MQTSPGRILYAEGGWVTIRQAKRWEKDSVWLFLTQKALDTTGKPKSEQYQKSCKLQRVITNDFREFFAAYPAREGSASKMALGGIGGHSGLDNIDRTFRLSTVVPT